MEFAALAVSPASLESPAQGLAGEFYFVCVSCTPTIIFMKKRNKYKAQNSRQNYGQGHVAAVIN